MSFIVFPRNNLGNLLLETWLQLKFFKKYLKITFFNFYIILIYL
jgi:hypothetical protein